jgi:hypothetical protein
MSVSPARARKLALSLENVREAPHFDRAAFRTPRRIFATLAKSGADLNIGLTPDLQEFYCEQAPDALAPVSGGWGRAGWTRCSLRKIDEATLLSAIKAAHALANAPAAKRKRRKS